MKKINYYYVRHGRTEYNDQGRMQGWCDSPLTESGIQDAYRTKELLKDVPFRYAYSSSLPRCVTTIGIIMEGRDVEIRYSDKLKETNFGDLEAKVIKDHYEDVDYRRKVTLDWSDIGGENMEMEAKRVREIYQEIYDACDDGDNVLVVSHGAVYLHMLNFMLHIDMRDYVDKVAMQANGHAVPNGFVGVFSYDGKEYTLESIYGQNDNLIKNLKKLTFSSYE